MLNAESFMQGAALIKWLCYLGCRWLNDRKYLQVIKVLFAKKKIIFDRWDG